MNIIINEAVDFIFAFNRFGLRNKNINPDYPRLEMLNQWCLEYEKKLSPFLLNDISLLSEKTIFITLYLFEKIHKNKINTVDDFFKLLDQLSSSQLKDEVLSSSLKNPSIELTVENIYNEIVNNRIYLGYDIKDEAFLIYGILKEPDTFLARLKTTYHQFYDLVFSESKNNFEQSSKEKYLWHRNRLKKDPLNYLKALGLNNLLKQSSTLNSLTLYYSFFADNDISTRWESKIVIIGAAIDKKVIQQSAKSQTDLFFSCLGDLKRLEILRLTSKRRWYSSELANHFNLKPATLSYHINKLVEADLLIIKKGGAKRFYYTLNKETFALFLDYASQDLLGKSRFD